MSDKADCAGFVSGAGDDARSTGLGTSVSSASADSGPVSGAIIAGGASVEMNRTAPLTGTNYHGH
jgi:hypothetical protein